MRVIVGSRQMNIAEAAVAIGDGAVESATPTPSDVVYGDVMMSHRWLLLGYNDAAVAAPLRFTSAVNNAAPLRYN